MAANDDLVAMVASIFKVCAFVLRLVPVGMGLCTWVSPPPCECTTLHTPPAALAPQVPMCFITLMGEETVRFISTVGMAKQKMRRNLSFCAWTLLPEFPEALVVQDTTQDARFSHHPLVTGPPHLRFYAGCPLTAANNVRVGTL